MSWAPDYCTSDELKSYLRIPTADTTDNSELAVAITAASRAVDLACNRQFGQTSPAAARYFTARWDKDRCVHVLDLEDVQDTAGLTVAGDGDDDDTYDVTITEYRLLPLNAAADGMPYTQIVMKYAASTDVPTGEGRVKVTAKWGWSAVPTTVKQATLIQASRFFARRNSPYGIAGSPDLGNELRLLDRVDPDVRTMLRPYRKHWVAG